MNFHNRGCLQPENAESGKSHCRRMGSAWLTQHFSDRKLTLYWDENWPQPGNELKWWLMITASLMHHKPSVWGPFVFYLHLPLPLSLPCWVSPLLVEGIGKLEHSRARVRAAMIVDGVGAGNHPLTTVPERTTMHSDTEDNNFTVSTNYAILVFSTCL